MSAPRLPGWVTAARALHAASLYLYPRALRETHGEEMKQAFLDRCREAVAGGRGPIGLLLGELIPDTLRAVPESHFSQPAFGSNPRQLLALGVLCLALIGVLTRDSLNGWILDRVFALRYQWRDYRYQSELHRLEGATRAQAAAMAASTDPGRRAIAAYLYSSLAPDRIATVEVIGEGYPGAGWNGTAAGSAEDAERARQLALAIESDSPTVLAIAALACTPETADCDRHALVERLVAVDADNGFAQEMALSNAVQRKDEPAQAAALHAMALATRYETHRADLAERLFAAATELDASRSHLAAVAWSLQRTQYGTLQDWYGTARFACTPQRDNASSRPHWIDRHPESGEDCARITHLLSRSDDFAAATWGLFRIAALAPGEPAGVAARRKHRELAWLRFNLAGTSTTDPHGSRCTPWTEADWARWATSYDPRGGEIGAARRWLAANHQPLQPPAWFMADGG